MINALYDLRLAIATMHRDTGVFVAYVNLAGAFMYAVVSTIDQSSAGLVGLGLHLSTFAVFRTFAEVGYWKRIVCPLKY